MPDQLLHALAFDDTVRVVAAVSTDIVREAQSTHDTSPTATSALGRLLTATALIAATTKDDAQVEVRIDGGGPAGVLLARATSDGDVYGTLQEPHATAPVNDAGKLDVGAIVGTQGLLTVTRVLPHGDPYVGAVPLATGEIGDDIAHYYLQSEQVQSAIGVGVLCTADRGVSGAGGFLLQILGGASEEVLDELEARLATIRGLSREIDGGLGARELLERLVGDDNRVLAERDLRLHCPFDREHYRARVAGLGLEGLNAAFGELAEIEVICEFSRRAYIFARGDFPDVFRD